MRTEDPPLRIVSATANTYDQGLDLNDVEVKRERSSTPLNVDFEFFGSFISVVTQIGQDVQKLGFMLQNDKYKQCHRGFKTSTYEEFKNVNPDRVDGTCQWVLSQPRYRQWRTCEHDDLLWISADPGCGKSVLAKSLIDDEQQKAQEHTVCYFFFKDNELQKDTATTLCALLLDAASNIRHSSAPSFWIFFSFFSQMGIACQGIAKPTISRVC